MTKNELKARRKLLIKLQHATAQSNAKVRDAVKQNIGRAIEDIDRLRSLSHYLSSRQPKLDHSQRLVLFAVNCAVAYLIPITADAWGDRLDDETEDGGGS